MTTPTSPATSKWKSRRSGALRRRATSFIRSTSHDRAGLTLVELMVVLVVMAVLAGSIVPSIASATRRDDVDAAASRLEEMLEFACIAAMGRRRPVTVSFDPDRARCWVSAYRSVLPWRQTDDESPVQRLMAVQLPGDVTVFVEKAVEDGEGNEEGWNTVHFRPDGTAEDVLIELSDENGEVRLIELAAATGRAVRVEE